jgi:hypothetical protein
MRGVRSKGTNLLGDQIKALSQIKDRGKAAR